MYVYTYSVMSGFADICYFDCLKPHAPVKAPQLLNCYVTMPQELYLLKSVLSGQGCVANVLGLFDFTQDFTSDSLLILYTTSIVERS